MRDIDREISSLQRERKNALGKYGGKLQGVTAAPADVESDREKALGEREKTIRVSYETLRTETAKRTGGKLPGWWLPLD